MIGGIISFFVRLIMFGYILLLWKKLLLNEADNNIDAMNVVDLAELGIVEYDTTNLTVFHVLKK